MELSPPLFQQITFGLFIVLIGSITAGVGYLTYSDWRDKRRRKLETKTTSGNRRKK